MADLTSKQANFVSRSIETVEKVLAAADELSDLKREFIELGLAATINASAFAGDNAHLSLADLANLSDFEGALKTILDAGGRADLLKFRR